MNSLQIDWKLLDDFQTVSRIISAKTLHQLHSNPQNKIFVLIYSKMYLHYFRIREPKKST